MAQDRPHDVGAALIDERRIEVDDEAVGWVARIDYELATHQAGREIGPGHVFEARLEDGVRRHGDTLPEGRDSPDAVHRHDAHGRRSEQQVHE